MKHESNAYPKAKVSREVEGKEAKLPLKPWLSKLSAQGMSNPARMVGNPKVSAFIARSRSRTCGNRGARVWLGLTLKRRNSYGPGDLERRPFSRLQLVRRLDLIIVVAGGKELERR